MCAPSFSQLILSTVAVDAQTTCRNVQALSRLHCPDNGPVAFDLVLVTEECAWTAAGSVDWHYSHIWVLIAYLVNMSEVSSVLAPQIDQTAEGYMRHVKSAFSGLESSNYDVIIAWHTSQGYKVCKLMLFTLSFFKQ